MGGGVSAFSRHRRRHESEPDVNEVAEQDVLTVRRRHSSSLELSHHVRRFKFSFKRKKNSKDQLKPFRELILTWPLRDVEGLLKEFEASSFLYKLQESCDNARRQEQGFSQQMHSARCGFADFVIKFKHSLDSLESKLQNESFDVHRRFMALRCKNIKELRDASRNELDLTAMFSNISQQEFCEFIDFVYLEKWNGSEKLLNNLRDAFGCCRTLFDDCFAMEKEDVQHGDLVIKLSSLEENKIPLKPYSIRCDARVVGARSKLLRSLLLRGARNASGDWEVTLDEAIFPRALVPLFIHYFYVDQLDLNIIPNSDMSLSSLSEARAIISGRSPNIHLNRALQAMHVAKFFGIDKLVQLCEDVIVKWLTMENCVGVLQWASDGGSKFIARHATRMLEEDFVKIASSTILFELSAATMKSLTASHFVQATEIEILEAIIKWGEQELLRRMEEREPNIVADTCHSISRRGLRRAELSSDELKEILRPLMQNVRTDYILPPFHQVLTSAYTRGLLERAPLCEDLVVCPATAEINPDLPWFKPAEMSPGPRFFAPYYEALQKHSAQLRIKSSENGASSQDLADVPADVVAPQQLNVRCLNLLPEVLDDDKFSKARDLVCQAIAKVDVAHGIRNFPRRFQRTTAVQLITQRVLFELDVAEECFECVLEDNMPTGNGGDEPAVQVPGAPDIVLGH